MQIFLIIALLFSPTLSGHLVVWLDTTVHEVVEETFVENLPDDPFEEIVEADEPNDPTVYVQFIMNTHDWVLIDQSIATIHRVIDLHEEHNVPVDIYLTDSVMQGYLDHDPSLIERLATSDVVAVSHHARPPSPYAASFDWLGLSEMNDAELRETLERYLNEEIDLETGETTGEPGGYAYLAELMGYAPIVTGISASGRVGSMLSEMYAELGAAFVVEHGNHPYRLGDTKWSQYLRPEHAEVKLYENPTTDAGSVIDDHLEDLPVGEEDVYVNIKYHENDLYANGTTFSPVYWEDYDSGRRIINDRPWDLSVANTDLKTAGRQKQLWTLWENALIYVNEHPDAFTAINAFDLVEMVEEL